MSPSATYNINPESEFGVSKTLKPTTKTTTAAVTTIVQPTTSDHVKTISETPNGMVQGEILEDNSPGPFEGPEKLLEVWFAPSSDEVPVRGNVGRRVAPAHVRRKGLRTVQRDIWEGMLDEVHCKVLSVIEGEEVDAYLLSESSMFVWPHKLILKTCGTTTLLFGLPTLLKIASELCGMKAVWRCFYSRKTFMFPDRQVGPHKSWDDEVKVLDSHFENGSAYTVGRMNGDHWLLYLTAPSDNALHTDDEDEEESSSPRLQAPNGTSANGKGNLTNGVSAGSHANGHLNGNGTIPNGGIPKFLQPQPPSQPDETLEILMTKLSPSACALFFAPTGSTDTGHSDGAALSDRLGITNLIPNSTLDSFLFSPCGYSANILCGDRYATIHVTPEEEYSYASFECNVAFATKGGGEDLMKLLGKLMEIFQPGNVLTTLFVSIDEDSDADEEGSSGGVGAGALRIRGHKGLSAMMEKGFKPGYKKSDRILYEFQGYVLAFATFEKAGKGAN